MKFVCPYCGKQFIFPAYGAREPYAGAMYKMREGDAVRAIGYDDCQIARRKRFKLFGWWRSQEIANASEAVNA